PDQRRLRVALLRRDVFAFPLDLAGPQLDALQAVRAVQGVNMAVVVQRRRHQLTQPPAPPNDLRVGERLVQPNRETAFPVVGNEQGAVVPDRVGDGHVVIGRVRHLPAYLARGGIKAGRVLRGPVEQLPSRLGVDQDRGRITRTVRQTAPYFAARG